MMRNQLSKRMEAIVEIFWNNSLIIQKCLLIIYQWKLKGIFDHINMYVENFDDSFYGYDFE
jgi:hypothetical protein